LAKAALMAAMAPAAAIGAAGDETALDGGLPVEPGDALVVATSGASGAPKGVVLTHEAVAASARATNSRLGVTDDDHWLACLPLAHVGGLSVVTRALAAGTRLTVHPGFDPAAVEAAGATLVSLVTTALQRVDPARFRLVVLGGSAPPPDLPANVVATYGMTETGSGVVYDGRPLDGVDVRVGTDGEIHVRGPMLLRAYRDGTVPYDADGWYASGDLGRWTPDGRLLVEGRRSELIITGGENVWPEPVEAALRRHPKVADVAVAGTTDPEWGEAVTAYVVPAGVPPTLAELRDAVKQELPAHCAPRRLVLVETIPRSALGKVRRAALGDG
jgi:O-succinylbenzoic acid--CoA ligase